MERALVEFVSTLRRSGVSVSQVEAMDAVRAALCVGLEDRQALHHALRAVLVKRPADGPRFERCIRSFFSADGGNRGDLFGRLAAAGFEPELLDDLRELLDGAARQATGGGVWAAIAAGDGAVDHLLEMAGRRVDLSRLDDAARLGFFTMRTLDAAELPRAQTQLGALRRRLRDAHGPRGLALSDALEQELREFRGRGEKYVASQLDRETPDRGREALERSRFDSLQPDQVRAVQREVQRLAERMVGAAHVRRRRARRGRLDGRATLRSALASHGVPFEPRFRGRQRRLPELVVLCDVSDSVRASARFLLLFLHSVQRLFRHCRSFVFVSEVGEATELFESSSPDRAVQMAYGGAVVSVVDNSHYGRALSTFGERHADAVGPRTTLVIIGDARTNHFDPREADFARLAGRAGRVVWLNPQPRGAWYSGDSAMGAYAPYCDEVLPVYDLQTLSAAVRHLIRRKRGG